MLKTILALLVASVAAVSPAVGQIGAPGATDEVKTSRPQADVPGLSRDPSASDWVKTPRPPSASPFPGNIPPEHAADYASIVNLMSTYIIALNAGDLKTYAGVFAPDATLYWANGVEHGRDQIFKNLAGFVTGRNRRIPAGATTRPRGLTAVADQRINFTGPNTAHDVTMYFSLSLRDKAFGISEFGHTEDKYVKIDGKWYFQERRIWNERPGWPNQALFYPELGETDLRQPADTRK